MDFPFHLSQFIFHLFDWYLGRQPTVAILLTQAEYYALGDATKGALWINSFYIRDWISHSICPNLYFICLIRDVFRYLCSTWNHGLFYITQEPNPLALFVERNKHTIMFQLCFLPMLYCILMVFRPTTYCSNLVNTGRILCTW